MSTPRLFQLARAAAAAQTSGKSSAAKYRKQVEEDGWKALLNVCDLSVEDIQVVMGLGYTTMKHISVLGLHKNIAPLVEAGIPDAKAQLVLLFATYVLHANHHRQEMRDDLTFEEVLEFNFLLEHPEQISAPLVVPNFPGPILNPANHTVTSSSVAPTVTTVSPSSSELPLFLNPSVTSKKHKGTSNMEKSGVEFELPFRLLQNQNSNSNLSVPSLNSKRSKESKGSKKKKRNKKAKSALRGSSGASVCSKNSLMSCSSKKSVTWGKDPKYKANKIKIPAVLEIEEPPPPPPPELKESRWSSSSLDNVMECSERTEEMAKSKTKSVRRVRSVGSITRPFRRPSVEINSKEEADMWTGANTGSTTGLSGSSATGLSTSSGTTGNAVWQSSKKTTANSRRVKKVQSNKKIFGGQHTDTLLNEYDKQLMEDRSASSLPGLPGLQKDSNAMEKRSSSSSLPGLPIRRASLVVPPKEKSVTKAPPKPSAQVMNPAAQSTLRWAMALDVDEDLTDSDWSDSDSDDSDDSDSDDDSESSSEEDMENDEELLDHTTLDVQHATRQQAKKHQAKTYKTVGDEPRVFRWKTSNVTTHEWTLPANQILPINLQTLFRQAAENPEIDIQTQLQLALASAAGTSA